MQVNVHILAAITVLSRLADVGTTYMVTPSLKLEANSVVRRFGWWYAGLTVLIGLIPYYSPGIGVVVLTMSFMVAASNASKIFTARAIGEAEMAALSRRVIQAMPPWPGLLYMVSPGFFVAMLGGSVMYLYPHADQWGYYIGNGMLIYALAIFIWYPLRYISVRRQLARNAE